MSTSIIISIIDDIEQGPSKIRQSLEQALCDLTLKDPTTSEQLFHQLVNTIHSVEQAISKEIAEQEEDASCLLKSIELAISMPEHQSSKQEAVFERVAREQVQKSKNLSARIQEFVDALTEMCQIADAKIASCATSSCSLEETFQERLMGKPWTQASLTKIVVLYSDIFEAILELKEETKTSGTAGVWVAPDSFERKTTKYWVPQENLPQLLMTCASEAPLLVYGTTGRLSRTQDIPLDDLWKNLSSPISSIYFDSPQLDLYKERIKRREGAQLLRARWYGEKPPTPNKPVFLELKTHHESWIQAKSVKERVAILEKDVNTFLYSMNAVMPQSFAESLVLAATPKLKGDKLAKAVGLLLRMHTLVVRHKLRPCMRSTYNRLAFQSSKNNSLRLTLDRQVVVSDEKRCKHGEQWCIPFSPDEAKPDGHDHRTIPFAVFEIKLGEGQESAALKECIENGTILDAAKFSKFLTGAATFNHVNHLPYWADHPAFASFFHHQRPLPPRKTIYRDGEESATVSASSVETGLSRGARNEKKINDILSFLPPKTKRGTFVAPKKAVRIEPKTYFANERTFIQWVSAALFLVTTSALLLEFENGEGYAKSTATTLLIFALIISMYSVGLYYRRIWLMTNARPYGYISHFGPLVLTGVAIAGTWIILSKIRHMEFREELERSIEEARNKVRFIRAEPGVCMEHDISSFSRLEFEPSDVIVDLKRNQLLVPSLSEIYGFPLPDWNSEGTLEIPNVSSTIVAQIELADFESATLVNDDTLYAISETDTETLEQSPHMYSMERSAFGHFEVTSRWKLETPDPEGMIVVSQDDDSSSLLVSGQNGEGPLSAVVQRFAIPKPNQIPNSPNSNSVSTSTPTLEASRNLNEKLLDANMEDPKIGAMTYFEGILYILHDHARVVRAWDMETGTFQAEWPLPGVPKSTGKEWEGLAFQRIRVPSASLVRPSSFIPNHNLRRRRTQATDEPDDDHRWKEEDDNEQEEDEVEEEEEEEEDDDDDDDDDDDEEEEEEEDTSILVLHLTHDTPAAIWSVVVKEGDVKGSIEYPACADVFR